MKNEGKKRIYYFDPQGYYRQDDSNFDTPKAIFPYHTSNF